MVVRYDRILAAYQWVPPWVIYRYWVTFFVLFHVGCADVKPASPQRDVSHDTRFWSDFTDDITVNGATVCGQCQLDDSGETVIFFYQVKSEQAKQRWLTIRQPVHLTGQGSMKRLLPATNFNQFDTQDFYATQHITHQITLSQCTVTQSTARSIWQKLADQLHGWHAQGIASAQRYPSH